jgi:hypothetical protein
VEQFLLGHGHSILSSRGLYDFLDGGYWGQADGKPASFEELRARKAGEDLQFFRLNERSPLDSRRTKSPFLDNVVIGVIPQSELTEYFSFVETIYVPFGNLKAEKVFYDGLALLFGRLPKIYTQSDLKDITGKYYGTVLLAKTWLFLSRVFLALISVASIAFLVSKARPSIFSVRKA